MAGRTLLSTPGFVLHSTPYGDSSAVVKVFSRLLGVRSYIIKGVRRTGGRIRQVMLQPMTCVDMVVYDNQRVSLNHIKEMALRGKACAADPVVDALRFFMAEVLYKSLPEAESNPALWDYVERIVRSLAVEETESAAGASASQLPLRFLLAVLDQLGLLPLDNRSAASPWFDLQEGRFVGTQTATTVSPANSTLLHNYLSDGDFAEASLSLRSDLLVLLLDYCQLHISSFHHFKSHEILHAVLQG